MNANRSTRVLVLLLTGAMGAVLLTGCGAKAPQEANDALNKVLKSLVDTDPDAFLLLVVPDQREGLGEVDELEFLASAMSYKIDNEFDMDVTDTSAAISVVLYFDEEQKNFSNIFFVMKKVDGAWLFDLAETVKKEREADGAHAFQVWQIEVQPGG